MATKAFQKIYTKITQITKATCSLKATGVGYDELASVDGKLAQVVKIIGDEVTLQVFSGTEGIRTNAEVVFMGKAPSLKVGDQLAGRFFNAYGDPIDGGPVPEGKDVEIGGPSVNPVRRQQPSELIATGIAGIDLNNTLVTGQKIPFFADPDQPFNQVMAMVALRAQSDKIILGGMGMTNDDYLFFKNTFSNAGALVTIVEENERHPCTLDWDSLDMLEHAVKEVEKDEELRAVVLKSDSPKSFVVGANINVLKTLDADNIQDWVKNGHRIFRRLQELPVPVIAKVEKFALGGGLELAMSCDMIIASEEARFAQPEAGLGVMPGWGGSYRLANLIGLNRAKEMFFTGEQITAAQAYEWGLVNHVYPADELDAGVGAILEQILKNDRKVLQLTKEIIHAHNLKEVAQSAYEEAATSAVVMSSPSTLGRLKAFFDSRKKK